MKLLTLALALVFLSNANICIAQQTGKTVTGQILAAEDQNPVQGVSVRVKGTPNLSGSQEDGIYYIEVRSSDSTLVFTHPDYDPKEVRLTHETEYNVTLKKRRP